MTSALYLEHNLDSLQDLTIHLRRNFTLLRELENRADVIRQTIIGVLSDDLVPNISKMDVGTRKEKVNAVQGLFNKAKEYEDDKVQLTVHTYELVGKYMRRFDSSLTRFESENQKKATSSRAEQQAAADQKTSPIKTRSKRESSVGARVEAETEKAKRKRKRTADRDMLDIPVNRYEPTFCLCHRKSYGKMIACDNPDCPIEWFHIKCVHVKIIPKGKWYCPKCTKGKDNVKRETK